MSADAPIIFLVGPTASGKTDLALELSERLPCELISVDSAMVYKGLDIGTAKPDAETLKRYPHALIDICEPDEIYSAADFCTDAKIEIERIHQQGKIPLLVGGTMLYFQALQNGLSKLPESDPALRQSYIELAEKDGAQVLHQRLAKVDPESAQRLNPNDKQRVQRALEVFDLTGRSLTQLWQEQKQQGYQGPIRSFALMPERALLHGRIAQRFQLMLEMGFVDEVQQFYQCGDLSLDLPSMRAVGYRQVWNYLADEIDYQQMQAKALAATRQLAKRQCTWLRGWPELEYLNPETENLVGLIKQRIA